MRKRGQEFEAAAKTYLLQQGLESICDNFHCRLGEIDLIMSTGDVLVFVEVKYRASSRYGGAVAAVSTSKQRKLIKTANYYLHSNGINVYQQHCRFDVMAITGQLTNPQFEWFKNAFIIES